MQGKGWSNAEHAWGFDRLVLVGVFLLFQFLIIRLSGLAGLAVDKSVRVTNLVVIKTTNRSSLENVFAGSRAV